MVALILAERPTTLNASVYHLVIYWDWKHLVHFPNFLLLFVQELHLTSFASVTPASVAEHSGEMGLSV